MSEGFFPLNPAAAGGDKAAGFTRSDGVKVQENIMQTQSGTADPQSINAGNPMPANIATVGGGWTAHTLTSLATTNPTVVKASPGVLGDVQIFNINSAPRYIKFSDTSSPPTVGTTPVVRKLLIPGGASSVGSGVIAPILGGLKFLNGISYCITAGEADSDATAIGAGEVIVNLGYA